MSTLEGLEERLAAAESRIAELERRGAADGPFVSAGDALAAAIARVASSARSRIGFGADSRIGPPADSGAVPDSLFTTERCVLAQNIQSIVGI